MGKKMGSWSGMRKYLEQEMLAECLKGNIRYSCTSFAGMDGFCVFEICVNGCVVKRFSWETVNTYFIENGLKKECNPYGKLEYWAGFSELLDGVPVELRTEYTDEEFCEALEKYRNLPIEKSLYSKNPIQRMFAILDRRVGKRRIISAMDSLNEQPEWLRTFYSLRADCELAGS